MIKYGLSILILITCLSVSSLSMAKGETEQVKSAHSCTKIELKIQRLECFDRVFSTPIYGVRRYTNKPKSWIRATTSELKRESGSQPLLTIADNNADVWVTMPAVNPKQGETAPLLILSCMSGISRTELALSKPISDGRVKVTLGNGETEYWRNDDSGLLLSSGRGAVAVGHIASMLLMNELEIRSNSPALDGLRFDTANLLEVIQPVRERCNW